MGISRRKQAHRLLQHGQEAAEGDAVTQVRLLHGGDLHAVLHALETDDGRRLEQTFGRLHLGARYVNGQVQTVLKLFAMRGRGSQDTLTSVGMQMYGKKRFGLSGA